MNSEFDYQSEEGGEYSENCENLQLDADLAEDKFYLDMFRRRRISAFVRNALIVAGVLGAGGVYLQSRNDSKANEFSSIVSLEMGDPAVKKIVENLFWVSINMKTDFSREKSKSEEIKVFLVADNDAVNLNYDWLKNVFDESANDNEVELENLSGELAYSAYKLKLYGKIGNQSYLWADRGGEVMILRQDDYLAEGLMKLTGNRPIFKFKDKNVDLPYLMLSPILNSDGEVIAVKYVPLVDLNEGDRYSTVTGLSRVSSSKELIELVGEVQKVIREVEKGEMDLEKEIVWDGCLYKNDESFADLKARLHDSVVQLSWKDGYCSGFVYDDNTLVTARHCLKDGRKLDKVVYYAPGFGVIEAGGSVQRTVVSEVEDLGIAVFVSPVFSAVPKLEVSTESIAGKYHDPYFIYSFNGRDKSGKKVPGRAIGNNFDMDTYVLNPLRSLYEVVPNNFDQVTYNGGIIGGNSGGPIVNCHGEVVSIVATVQGLCPNVTVGIIESLKKKALEKKPVKEKDAGLEDGG